MNDLPRALTPARAAAALALVATLLHLSLAGEVALGVDEAHYALYGLIPDWSYFDHPPLVGWMQALILLFSGSEFALRLWPILLALLATLALFHLARTLFPEGPWIAAIAVALLHSAVVFQLVSLAMVPEDPLLLFGLLGALALFKAVHENRLRHWLGVGLFFGLAGLSKYTAILLPVTALLLLGVERRFGLLRTPGPWIAAAIALAAVLPVLLWNAQHGWISFAYQWDHGAPGREWSGLRALRSFAGQLLAYAPGIVIFGIAATVAARREWRHPGVRFSLLLALPLMALFAWGAGFEETLPHWTLLGWAALAPLTAWWLARNWERRPVRLGAWLSLGYSLILVAAIHAQFIHPWLPFQPLRHPLADLYGWREAAGQAAALRRGLGDEARLLVGNWSHASRIAWYAREPVRVIDDRFDQFDLWYGTPAAGESGLLLLPEKGLERRQEAFARFESCRGQGTLPVELDGKLVNRFHFFACHGYRG